MNNDNDNDLLDLLKVLLGAGAVIALFCLGPGSFRTDVAGWLTQHRLLVEHPVIPLPGLSGIGLDAARLVVLAGLLIIAGALTWIALRTRKSHH
ncbi:hypothetical protein AB0F43_31795 [Kribbella sp. NPDC023972]|uniref:hypothetical protein n=1 Tax=Kribbella sp. NPDC023972 TaxID=3154795 RepID=UPI0033F5D9B0